MARSLADSPTDTCGVDEPPGSPPIPTNSSDGIHGGAGRLIDHDPLTAGQPVGADSTFPRWASPAAPPASGPTVTLRCSPMIGHDLQQTIEEIAATAAMEPDTATARPDRDSRGSRLEFATDIVDLVRHQEHRHLPCGTSTTASSVSVGPRWRRQPARRRPPPTLPVRPAPQRPLPCRGSWSPAASVDQHELRDRSNRRRSAPDHVTPGCPRPRGLTAQDPVDQRRLADIGPPTATTGRLGSTARPLLDSPS